MRGMTERETTWKVDDVGKAAFTTAMAISTARVTTATPIQTLVVKGLKMVLTDAAGLGRPVAKPMVRT